MGILRQLMEIIELSLPGPKLIRLKAFEDERGFFKECYQHARYQDQEITPLFVQDNLSFSKQGVIRGMHFQSSPGQAKLVSALEGTIFDVVVDIREGSPYFGKWEGVYLDAAKHEQLFVPSGFAHGFCVVSPGGAKVHYKVSSPYDPSTEYSFRFNDPFVAIQWPVEKPVLSKRDLEAPLFKELFP